MQKTLLACVWHFCQAAPFGQLPPVTFEGLGVPPSFVHSMVGDKIWQGYWEERHPHIEMKNWIPRSLLQILQHVSNKKAAEHQECTLALNPSVARLQAASRAAAARKSRGKPY